MPASRGKVLLVYVPAHQKLKEYRTQQNGCVATVQAPLGSIIHWPPHLTRPIIPTDVTTKHRMFVESMEVLLGRVLREDFCHR